MVDFLKQEQEQKEMVTKNTQYENYCDFVKNLIDTDLALFGDWQKMYAEMLNEMFDLTSRSVLDIGCAYGTHLHGISYYTSDVLGCDVNEKSINDSPYSELKGKLLNISPIQLKEKLPNTKFDLIHSHMVFEHFPTWEYTEELVNKIPSILKSGGIVYSVLVAGRHDTKEEILERYKGGEKIDLTHVNVWPLEQWHELFEKSGLINIEEYIKPIYMLYQSPSGFSFYNEYNWDQLIYMKQDNLSIFEYYADILDRVKDILEKQKSYANKEIYKKVLNTELLPEISTLIKKYA